MSTPSSTSLKPRAFSFGQNWEEFVRAHFNEERVRQARQHILDFLGMPNLQGKSFLDIGCGSGLSSLAAWQAGAARVVSFDVDPASVRTTLRLREDQGSPPNWSVAEGSILDPAFLASVEPADIVYSWGVLHHTGEMWTAVRNAASFLRPGSLFYIGLYVTTARTPYWIQVKHRYNRASTAVKRLMEGHYILRHVVLPQLVRGQNPIRYIREYSHRRGMEFLTDVRDWLGGYPYEDARLEEVVRFCHRELGLTLTNLAPTPGFSEYLFTKPG